jgi:hypothetical protein
MTTHQGIADRVGDMQVVEHTTRSGRVGGWRIRLQIDDGAKFRTGVSQPIYQATSIVTAEGGSLSRVLPLVLNELFAKFPGPTKDSRERYLYN